MNRFLPSLIVLLCLCGCQSAPTLVRYEPKTYTPVPLRSNEEVATLDNKRYAKDTVGQFGYNLHHIDGVSVMTLVMREQRAYLNPGRHVVEIDSFGPQGGGRRKVSFDAVAGGKYEADGRVLEDRVEMWIQTVDSHRVVSNVAVLPLARPPWPIF
jgi:hypothetical protein